MNKVVQFCRECAAELRKVVWPSWNTAVASVRVVIVSTCVIAIILGLLDWAFTEGLRLIF